MSIVKDVYNIVVLYTSTTNNTTLTKHMSALMQNVPAHSAIRVISTENRQSVIKTFYVDILMNQNAISFKSFNIDTKSINYRCVL